MNTARLILALLFSIALAGCALGIDHAANKYLPYPLAQMKEKEYQDKLQAAVHWDALAANEATEIIKTVGNGASISFSADSPDTDFGKAYKKMLTGHLLDNGIKVLGSAGNYLLNYQVQVVIHKDRDPLNWPAGSVTAATGGALLIAHASTNWSKPGLAALLPAVAADKLLEISKEGITPNIEVLITTELHKLEEIVQSSTRTYYFNPGDKALYESPEPPNPSRSFQVTDQS